MEDGEKEERIMLNDRNYDDNDIAMMMMMMMTTRMMKASMTRTTTCLANQQTASGAGAERLRLEQVLRRT